MDRRKWRKKGQVGKEKEGREGVRKKVKAGRKREGKDWRRER